VASSAVPDFFDGYELNYCLYNPKDGELCVARANPFEKRVEVRRSF